MQKLSCVVGWRTLTHGPRAACHERRLAGTASIYPKWLNFSQKFKDAALTTKDGKMASQEKLQPGRQL
jgi:hypothetical protein